MILTNSAQTIITPTPEYEQLQANGLDLTIEKIWAINLDTFKLTNSTKEYCSLEEIMPDKNNTWTIPKGSYVIQYEQRFAIPPGECGFIVPRSYLALNGVQIISGLCDSGFGWVSEENVDPQPVKNGLIINQGFFSIEKGTRISQYIIMKSESSRDLYNGERFNIDRDELIKVLSGAAEEASN